MTAMQYMALLKYLPMIVGSRVSPNNRHWKFLLHLSHLVDLIFAVRFTKSMARYLKAVISDHLAMFVELYDGNGSVRLKPKHHLLVHLPTIILKCGPLVGMSCLRYELKIRFLNDLHTLFAILKISVAHLHIATNNVHYSCFYQMIAFVMLSQMQRHVLCLFSHCYFTAFYVHNLKSNQPMTLLH